MGRASASVFRESDVVASVDSETIVLAVDLGVLDGDRAIRRDIEAVGVLSKRIAIG